MTSEVKSKDVVTIILILCSLALSLFAVWVIITFRSAPTGTVGHQTEKLPAYYNNVFRAEDLGSSEFLLPDPIVRLRGKPLFPELSAVGPHDLLGFRNFDIPRIADVVVIGDSQSYGNNAFLSESWPSVLQGLLQEDNISARVYSLATGSWSALQYLSMIRKAAAFQPRVVVVAFYTGNDALEAFRTAYTTPYWKGFRVNPSLDMSHDPKTAFPPPESDRWNVTFPEGDSTILTPGHRLASNDRRSEVVQAGFEIMKKAAAEMTKIANASGYGLVFTIIPTKELAYHERLKATQIELRPAYQSLVNDEVKNIDELKDFFLTLPIQGYVDLVAPLQAAVRSRTDIYPDNMNGHPFPPGYAVIAKAIFEVARKSVPNPTSFYGPLKVDVTPEESMFFLLNSNGLHHALTKKAIVESGWSEESIRSVSIRDIASQPLIGRISRGDPERYGPPSLE